MKLEKIYIFALFLIVLLLNINSLNLPYYWDDLNYVIPAVDYVYKNSPTIFLWERGLGHPPFFFILSGLIFKLIGNSNLIGHLIILFFSFLTLLFTYLIGKKLFSIKVGVIASLLLAFTPIFVSYSSLFYLEMPLTALITGSVYFAIKNKPYLSILFGSLAVLTKETGIVAVIGILFAKLIKRERKNLIYITPVFVFLLLIVLNKMHYNNFLFPISTSLITIDPIKNILVSIVVLKSIFFDQYRWILTSAIILCSISKKSFKKPRKQIIISLTLSLILLITIFSLKLLNLSIYFQNIDNYLALLEKFSILISILFFFLLMNIKEFINLYIKKDLYELCLPLILIIGIYFIIIPFPPRYGLPAYPLLFVIFSFALTKLFRKYSYLFVLFVIILFLTQYTGERSLSGFVLEDNLEYRDFVMIRQQAANFILENYPNSTILAAYPLSLDLQHPYGGYVDKEFNVITIDPYGGLTNKNYTQFLHPEMIPKKEINLSEIDLSYYSPQEYPTGEVNKIRKQLNLTLIKRFELNNKSTEIYLANK